MQHSRTTADFDPNDPALRPIRLVEVELTKPLPSISASHEGLRYDQARVLVRACTYPLGRIELKLENGELEAGALASRIWQSLRTEINDFLIRNGLPAVDHLDASGLPETSVTPLLFAERARILVDAPFVSVVICTRDRTTQLQTALNSILDMEYQNYEIVIVDNVPRTSATHDMIKQHFADTDRIRYVVENRPGVSFARNCGLNHARGEIIAYVDDDIIADRHWLIEVVRAFQTGDKVACVTGPLLPTELDSPVQLLSEQFRGRDMEFVRSVFDLESHKRTDALYPWAAGVYGGGGANMSFRTAVLREINGFDPALGTGTPTYGGEDLAVFVDVITRGYQIVYEPGTIIYHASRAHYDALRLQLYGYGVGLTAYLTRFIFNGPAHLFDMLPKLGRGLFYLLSPKSGKNHKRNHSYPRELSRLELLGMLYGPIAYLRSRWVTAEKRT